MADFVLVIMLISWATCALTGALIAIFRGNSGFLGFICAMLFGVFGLAMIASMQRQPLSDEKRCDTCDEIIRSRAKLCPHCRSEQPVPVDPVMVI